MRLARERERQRLEIDHGLAAEAAADLDAVTRSFETSMPSILAQWPRTMKWPCVLHHSSAWPSSEKLAMQACGSM